MKQEIFKFEKQELRVLSDENGNPLIVAKDISDILGYAKAEKAVKILDDDEYLMHQIGASGQKRNC